MAMGDDDKADDYADAALIFGLVKERFHGGNKYIYDRFVDLVKAQSHLQSEDTRHEQIIQNTAALFSELQSLFTAKNNDLIEKLRAFMNYRVALDEESSNIIKRECVDFVNKLKNTLTDYENYMQLVKMIKSFNQHKDTERVRREAYPLLKKHPGLEISLDGDYVGEAKEGYCRPVRDMLASRERAKADLEELKNTKFKVRELDEEEEILIWKEEKMVKSEVDFDRMLCAKEALQKLIDDYSDRNPRNRMEAVKVGDCVSDMDLKLLKDMFKESRKYYSLLHEELVEVRKARDEAKDIIRYLVKRMDNLTLGWSEEKEQLVRSNHDDALKIELFDWRRCR